MASHSRTLRSGGKVPVAMEAEPHVQQKKRGRKQTEIVPPSVPGEDLDGDRSTSPLTPVPEESAVGAGLGVGPDVGGEPGVVGREEEGGSQAADGQAEAGEMLEPPRTPPPSALLFRDVRVTVDMGAGIPDELFVVRNADIKKDVQTGMLFTDLMEAFSHLVDNNSPLKEYRTGRVYVPTDDGELNLNIARVLSGDVANTAPQEYNRLPLTVDAVSGVYKARIRLRFLPGAAAPAVPVPLPTFHNVSTPPPPALGVSDDEEVEVLDGAALPTEEVVAYLRRTWGTSPWTGGKGSSMAVCLERMRPTIEQTEVMRKSWKKNTYDAWLIPLKDEKYTYEGRFVGAPVNVDVLCLIFHGADTTYKEEYRWFVSKGRKYPEVERWVHGEESAFGAVFDEMGRGAFKLAFARKQGHEKLWKDKPEWYTRREATEAAARSSPDAARVPKRRRLMLAAAASGSAPVKTKAKVVVSSDEDEV